MPHNSEQNAELVGKCRSLSRKFQTKKITQEEFDTELCHISMAYGFDELDWAQAPPAPASVVDHLALSREDRRDYLRTDPNFWWDGKPREWRDSVSRVDAENSSHETHLRFMLTTLAKDPVAFGKIRAKLAIYELNRKQPRRRVECDPEAEAVAKMFAGGEVVKAPRREAANA